MSNKRLKGLEAQERKSARKLMEAFKESRTKRPVSWLDRQLAQPSQVEQLNAANSHARIKWGNALWAEFVSHHELSETRRIPNVPLFWVTLLDIKCFTKCDATEIDLVAMAKFLRRGLRGLSYVGMFDPALYVDIDPRTNFADRRGVNWHLHLFVWGLSAAKMKVRCEKMNAKGPHVLTSIMPKGRGAHWMPVTPETLEIRFRYMVKWPQKEYRVGCRMTCKPGTHRRRKFKHNKADLRKGGYVTLFHLLKRVTLPELTVAGGEGSSLRGQALVKCTRRERPRSKNVGVLRRLGHVRQTCK
ncbi:hypothetical protein RA307_15180 [Xanthobacteraceae bacterium Astr-EGSB]|uniref:hypothetical protein n=1 Tax=Astrobacterium formosum TaxID=3069710 RepID=UPI0027B7B0E7|nr:hypothetical protein [Xanthobacteraceae bacterium Astr-EGSB]